MTRILFANIGWMISYKGLSATDQISAGGAYDDTQKHEVFNFLDIDGKCYGYLQPKGFTLNLERIDPSISPDTDDLHHVLVIWFARNPILGGSRIVGWYKNATVYRFSQESSYPQRNDYSYYIQATAKNCTLLPVDERTKLIPRGKNFAGRSNIWYADKPEAIPFRKEIIDYVENYTPTIRKKSPRGPITISVETRKKIEKIAIHKIWALYESRGYEIKDRQKDYTGWDLEARNGKDILRLEVKGQGGDTPYVHISRNEYEKMLTHKKSYRLCVVMDCLKKPTPYIFLYQDGDKWVCEHNSTIQLDLDEQVAAIATFQVSNSDDEDDAGSTGD